MGFAGKLEPGRKSGWVGDSAIRLAPEGHRPQLDPVSGRPRPTYPHEHPPAGHRPVRFCKGAHHYDTFTRGSPHETYRVNTPQCYQG